MGQNKETYSVEVVHTGKAATIFTIIEASASPKAVLDDIGVIGNRVFRACPASCPTCGSSELSTLELIGVANRPLFWECCSCGALYCMEERKWIEKRIKKLDGFWTIHTAWDVPEQDEFN